MPLRVLKTHVKETADFDVLNNKHVRVIEDLTEATPFSLSRVTVIRSSNFALSTSVIMCQLSPKSISTNDGILGKEWYIAAEGPEDYLLIMKVLQWIRQYKRVTIRRLCSRYVEAGIGTGTRPAECKIRAGADCVLNTLKLLKEVEKQQNLDITITELEIHRFEINHPVLTQLLLDTSKVNKDMRSITISKCILPCSVSKHIRWQLHTCNRLELIDHHV